MDERRVPLRDDDDEHAPGTLSWLQAWYASQCNGDWEHSYGVTIETLDNPGWRLTVDLADTALTGRGFVRKELHRSEHDWLTAWVDEDRFEAACGPLNLGEAIHEFRVFAEMFLR